MEPLISVIIPIYKVESFLQKCVESIISQTYKNLEIILVDDGSPDRCGEICDKYAEKDTRIIVIHKKNGGLSDARNVGLSYSKGKYIVFVDSDDYMVSDGIEYLYKIAQLYSSDLVIGGVEKFDDATGKIIWTTADNNEDVHVFNNRQEAMKDMFLEGCASWARLYKREIHEGCLFPIGEINEDEAIMLHILNKCNVVVKTNRVVYKYRYRFKSITSSGWNISKLAWNKHCKDNVEYVKENYPELIKYAEYRYFSSIVWCLNNMTANVYEFKDYIIIFRKQLRKMLFKVLKSGMLKKKEIIRSILVGYFYYFYVAVVKILGKHYT